MPSAVKGVLVSAQISLAILFLVLVLGAITLAIAVVAVFVRVMFFRPIVLPVAIVFSARAQTVAVARVERHIGVAPISVVTPLLTTGDAIWVVGVT